MDPSRRLWWISGLAVAAGFGILIGWRGKSVLEQRREGLDELKTIQSHSTKELDEVVNGGHSPEQVAERIQVYTNKIGAAAAAMSPNERKALFATQRVFSRMAPLMATYESTLKELNEAGATAPATITSLEVLKSRVEMAKRFQSANRALLQFYRDLEKNFRAELDREQLAEPTKGEVLGGFRRGASIDMNVVIRESDQEIATTVLELLELLRRHFGQWTADPDGSLTFKQDAALGDYMALQNKLRTASEKQQQAQRELLKRAELEQRSK